MTKKPKARLAGRDAETGLFIPVAEARRRHSTAVVERIKLPTKRKPTPK